MFTAKEVMTAPVITVTENQTLQDVIELIAKHSFSGVPVVNDEGIVTGIVSDTDIIRYSHQINVVPLANLSGWISPHTDISDLVAVRKGIEQLHRTKVRQIMTKKVFTVKENGSINEIARLMSRRNINRIPVVDDLGKPIGIVTRANVVQCMTKT
ncbi:MAG TPA: CBS domain-containing protein [Candidatus Limnocylindrales bacterium]|nr:CBS domain-containing protein [Candidatus Limnocylindrales bacterium]